MEGDEPDLVSLSQKLAGMSDEQLLDSIVNGDSGTLQLMNQLGGFSEVPFPKPDEIEEFFGQIYEAQGKHIFGDKLRIDEIDRFCAFGRKDIPTGEVSSEKFNALKKKHEAAKKCALTMDKWNRDWGFTLEALRQQLTAKEQKEGTSLTVYVEKMLDLITTIEIEQQDKNANGMGRKFLFNNNLSEPDADSSRDRKESDAAAQLVAITRLRSSDASVDTVPAVRAVAPKAARVSSSSDPNKRKMRPKIPSKETPPPIQHEPQDRDAMPDPWDKLATDVQVAAPNPDLLLNNNIFEDQDLSTQLDMLQPLVNQISAAEDNRNSSEEEERLFELDEEGAKPFLPSWVTLVPEDKLVCMRADTCAVPIDDNDCDWQNAAEHVRPTQQCVNYVEF